MIRAFGEFDAYDQGISPNTRAALLALERFAVANGRKWKAKLRRIWEAGNDEGDLRLARNIIGPVNLDYIIVSPPKRKAS